MWFARVFALFPAGDDTLYGIGGLVASVLDEIRVQSCLIALGGIVGTNLRYAVGAAAGDALAVTLAVNTVGSFALGVVLAGAYGTDLHLPVSVGFCGAFTTFSSFSFQTVSLWERGERARAAVNAVANLLVSLLAFAGAWLLVSH